MIQIPASKHNPQAELSADVRSIHESPPGWGSDELTAFLATAHRNRYATYVQKKNEVRKLIAVDECFGRVGKNWLNPPNLMTPHFFFRSHSAFRSASEHALAGQAADMFPLVRTCLEYAGYALLIFKNPCLEETWLRRHDDADSPAIVRRKFAIGQVQAQIEKTDRHNAKVFARLYQQAIDFGAHPNERAVTGNMTVDRVEGRKIYQQILLHGDGIQLDHCLVTVARAGVCSLTVFQDVFGPRFELLGVNSDLLKIRAGL
jgi:hypothetical protein